MGRYVIERNVPGAGQMDAAALHELSAKSNAVLADMSDIEWIQSYVTEDKLFCVYESKDPELIREHAEKGGFPCDAIREVSGVITPETGK